MNEAVNDSSKLVAQAIKGLNEFDNSYEQIQDVIKLLEQALEKLISSM